MRSLLLGVLASLLLAWVVLLALVWREHRRGAGALRLRDALRILPDVVRLLARLRRDRALPRTVRLRVVLLLLYLASPVDLVPDVVPVLGWADDVLLVVLTLRVVVRRAGPGALEAHWPGTPQGLAALLRLVGTGSAPVSRSRRSPARPARPRGPRAPRTRR